MIEKISNWYNELPEKKKWVDMVTAVLTIPVLITVIAGNLGSLKKNEKPPTVSAQSPQPTVEKIIIRENTLPGGKQDEDNIGVNRNIEEPTPTVSCNETLQNYEITYPIENEKISVDPVCVKLTQTEQGNFCSVVRAYRVNNSGWTTYNNDPICLYNMASGPVKLEVRTKSSATGQEKTYTRNFSYQNESIPAQATPTTSPLISPSPTPLN